MCGFARYGIATPKGSKWRDPISLAILELQEKGTIQMLYNKWWKNTGDVCTRQVRLMLLPCSSFTIRSGVCEANGVMSSVLCIG